MISVSKIDRRNSGCFVNTATGAGEHRGPEDRGARRSEEDVVFFFMCLRRRLPRASGWSGETIVVAER